MAYGNLMEHSKHQYNWAEAFMKEVLTVVPRPRRLLPVRVLQQVWRWTTSLRHTHPHKHTCIYLYTTARAGYVHGTHSVGEPPGENKTVALGPCWQRLQQPLLPSYTPPLPPPCAIGGTLLHGGRARAICRCNSITISGSWPSSSISFSGLNDLYVASVSCTISVIHWMESAHTI